MRHNYTIGNLYCTIRDEHTLDLLCLEIDLVKERVFFVQVVGSDPIGYDGKWFDLYAWQSVNLDLMNDLTHWEQNYKIALIGNAGWVKKADLGLVFDGDNEFTPMAVGIIRSQCMGSKTMKVFTEEDYDFEAEEQ